MVGRFRRLEKSPEPAPSSPGPERKTATSGRSASLARAVPAAWTSSLAKRLAEPPTAAAPGSSINALKGAAAVHKRSSAPFTGRFAAALPQLTECLCHCRGEIAAARAHECSGARLFHHVGCRFGQNYPQSGGSSAKTAIENKAR